MKEEMLMDALTPRLIRFPLIPECGQWDVEAPKALAALMTLTCRIPGVRHAGPSILGTAERIFGVRRAVPASDVAAMMTPGDQNRPSRERTAAVRQILQSLTIDSYCDPNEKLPPTLNDPANKPFAPVSSFRVWGKGSGILWATPWGSSPNVESLPEGWARAMTPTLAAIAVLPSRSVPGSITGALGRDWSYRNPPGTAGALLVEFLETLPAMQKASAENGGRSMGATPEAKPPTLVRVG